MVMTRATKIGALATSVAFATIGLTGCAADEKTELGSGDGAGSSASAKTSLTFSVKKSKDAEAEEFTLTCDPSGGSVKDTKAACAALDKIDADWFKPVASGTSCTMQIGGPEEATVKGTYKGEAVEASFNQRNGCEISRWTTVAAVTGIGLSTPSAE